jgi:anti-sigma factor RsiW
MRGMHRRAEPEATIRCQHLVELVTDYLEGVLAPATVAEVDAHLALCPECAVYLEQMRDTVGRMGRVCLDGLSDTARTRLLAAFDDLSS